MGEDVTPKWLVAFATEVNSKSVPDFIKEIIARQQGSAQEDEDRAELLREPKANQESEDFEDELLSFIRNKEAGRHGYDSYFGIGTSGGPTPPPKNLTEMTVDEVLNWQRTARGTSESTAAGGYQIINKTLRDAKQKLGLRGDEQFTSELQDRIASDYLLRIKRNQQNQPSIDDFLSGNVPKEEFGNALATEWAGLPVLTETQRRTRQGPVTIKPGQSYYKGVGSNRSLVGQDEFQQYTQLFDAPQQQDFASAELDNSV